MDHTLADAVAKKMIGKGYTLCVAESVTAGSLQRALSQAADARKFFQGGLTTYNLGQKVKLLGVEPIHAESCNCVSVRVARQMSLGAGELLCGDWSVGITGYAAPVPECGITEPFAFYAISFRGKIRQSKKISAKKLKGLRAIDFYVEAILKNLKALLATT